MRMLTLATLALFAALPAVAELPDLAGREVTVATENAYPPLQFVDPKTGEAIGWEYDAMAEIAKRLNFKLVISNMSWDAMIPAVSEGQADIGMTGITIRDDRKEKVDFSDPYMHSEMLMLVRADEDRFTDAASFAAFTDGLHRRPGRHHALLRRRLRRPRRRRGQPAHQALRDHRRRRPGACAPATSTWC